MPFDRSRNRGVGAMTPTAAPGAAVPRDLLQDSIADILNADDVANTICFLRGRPRLGREVIVVGLDGAPDDVATSLRGRVWKSMDSRIGERCCSEPTFSRQARPGEGLAAPGCRRCPQFGRGVHVEGARGVGPGTGPGRQPPTGTRGVHPQAADLRVVW